MPKLTAKQEKFIQEYLIDLNATQAAIRAGYSPKTANRIGPQNLSKVGIQEGIQAVRDKQQERTQITADNVLREIHRLASFDPRKLFHPDGTPKQIHELDDDTAACIGGMEITSKTSADDPDKPELICVNKLKVWDKNAALEKLCKYLGLSIERREISGPGGGPIKTEGDVKLSPSAQKMLDRIISWEEETEPDE